VANPTIDAARLILGESLDLLSATIDGLPSEALDRRPAGQDTNSLAVIVTHALHSTRAWLSVAVDAPLPERDRPAEFAISADDLEGFRASVGALADDCRALLEGVETFDPARVGTAPWRPDLADEPVTAAWALMHALAHLREHVGHAELTRQLWAQGSDPEATTSR
jgi:uncharacterized damage-inducible protein DinB